MSEPTTEAAKTLLAAVEDMLVAESWGSWRTDDGDEAA